MNKRRTRNQEPGQEYNYSGLEPCLLIHPSRYKKTKLINICLLTATGPRKDAIFHFEYLFICSKKEQDPIQNIRSEQRME